MINKSTKQRQNNSMTKYEDELQLLAIAKTGDDRARAAIIKQYDRLCHKLAHKFAFTAPSHDHEDLVQSGRIGLLSAIDSFDPENGAKFMTWAYYHIRGCIAGCGRSDKKQPAYPKSIEDADRDHNLEDVSANIELREDFGKDLIIKIISECCGGLHTKRANVVMDRYGLLGRKELRNCEAAEKYGITKYAVNSHTYNFKCKARELFPHLRDFV
jgi:RNA polymerase sigma factor (sigma-70 family)